VAQFILAVNGYNDKTDFINCVVWGKQAGNLDKYCNKGSLIAIEGRISTRNYEDSGKKVYVTEVIVDNVQFLDSKKGVTATDCDTTATEEDAFAEFGKENNTGMELPF
jgi:single-strand DNA-binding protein